MSKQKKNRVPLRRLMGSYDVSVDQAARLIGRSAATVHQYRSVSGVDISDEDLDRLKNRLHEKYGEQ